MTLIKGGTVITMNSSKAVIEGGYVLTRGDRIAAIGTRQEAPPDHAVGEVLECQDCVIMPGLINTHTHAAMTCFRGLADDMPLETWWKNYIFPAETRYACPDFVYQGTLLAGMEMIKSGTTCLCDGYFFEEAAVRALSALGLRAIAGQGVVDVPTPDLPNPEQNVEKGIAYLESASASSLVTPTLFCHSAYTCSPDTLKKVKQVCRHHGVPFLVHLAETRAEVDEVKRRYGVSPVRHLSDLEILDEQIVAAHCIWVFPQELPLLAEAKVGIAHCPESNLKLASGVAPVPDFLRAGIRVGLGTDGCASNNNLDLLGEMDTAAKIHKVVQNDPAAIDALTVVRMATIGGAEVLGLQHQIGSLEEGKKADIIILNWRQPHLTPVYNYYSHLVYSATGHDVISVLIDGRLVMRDRQILTASEKEAMKSVGEIGERIRKGIGGEEENG